MSVPFHDPRMRGFRRRTSVDEVVALIDARIGALPSESVPMLRASGRVLVSNVVAEDDFPPFARCMMDGYAVRAEETFGADAYAPSVLRIVGSAMPGRAFPNRLDDGEAVRVATGASLPTGADAVVPVEQTESDAHSVRVIGGVAPGKHVGRRGEDVAAGSVILSAGTPLRPQSLGLLSALGVGNVDVIRRPRVAILITGDELLPPGTAAEGCRIADMNGPMVAALVERDGGIPELIGPVIDERDSLRVTIRQLCESHDVLLISGGSSTGPEDHAPSLIAELGELTVHGVALRPAAPAGLGFVAGVPCLLLPGNPVSCLCAYDLFAGRVVRRLGGRRPEWPYRSLVLPLARKLVSELGRLDYARVRVSDGAAEPLTVSGASVLSSTTRADGVVLVPPDLEGYPAGAAVTVWLYDG